jgi:UDP-N-acetylglucosamine acyltransferase
LANVSKMAMHGAEIHSTAIVHSRARLGSGVRIGAYSIVGEHVELGDGSVVGPYAEIGSRNLHLPDSDESLPIRIGAAAMIGTRVTMTGPIDLGRNTRVAHGAILRGPLTIGEGSQLFDQCVIGNPGQYPGRTDSIGSVVIGRSVTIREFAIVTQPILTAATTVGDHCYLMSRTQIDHDCALGCQVKTACGVTLGGSVRVGDHAYLGMNAVVHQRMRIGAGAMIGMNSVVTKHVPPYALIVGRKFIKINRRGLQLLGASASDMHALEVMYQSNARGTTAPAADNPWLLEAARFYEEIGPAPAVSACFAATAGAHPIDSE